MKYIQLKFFAFFILLSSSCYVTAQNSINAAAINPTEQSGVLQSISIGQVFSQEKTSSGISEIQGIQQPSPFEVLSIDESNPIAMTSTIFPNPTNGNVQLQLSRFDDDLSFVIHNSIGQQVRTGRIENLNTSISLHDVASGIYILNLVQANAPIKSIRIIKN